jgi:DNA-binding transcriptional regulator YhcF (GntR family)
MLIEIDFQSEEAIYIQLRNQIILAIAASLLHEGDALPPVRQMAGQIGINMHTVNKAYDVLRQEGFVTIDRRRGAVIAVDADRARALVQLKSSLQPVIARAVCQGVHPQEIHALVDQILDEWGISRRPAED